MGIEIRPSETTKHIKKLDQIAKHNLMSIFWNKLVDYTK